jgi:hypothetical protein
MWSESTRYSFSGGIEHPHRISLRTGAATAYPLYGSGAQLAVYGRNRHAGKSDRRRVQSCKMIDTEVREIPSLYPFLADCATALFTAIIAVTGVWALIYASRQLRQARESERIQHLLRFIEQFEQPPMTTYRRAVAEKRTKGIPYPPEAQEILNFFETIGLLVRRGYLDLDDVWSSFAYWMFNVYADFRDDIEQEQRDDESYYQDFCSLVDLLRTIEKDEGGRDDHPSKEDILEFWRDEVRTMAGAPVRKRKSRTAKGKAQNAEKLKGDSPESLNS